MFRIPGAAQPATTVKHFCWMLLSLGLQAARSGRSGMRESDVAGVLLADSNGPCLYRGMDIPSSPACLFVMLWQKCRSI